MSQRVNLPPESDRTRLAVVAVCCVLASGAAAGLLASPVSSAHERAGVTDGEGDLVVISSDEPASYEFAVDGAVEPAENRGATVDPGDEVEDGRVRGVVANGDADAYRVVGEVRSLILAGNATVQVDGQEVDPAALPTEWAVTFTECSTVEVAGDFEQGYVFSTVVFPVFGPEGDLLGYEENPVNEEFAVRNGTATLQAGTTLPENVSAFVAVRSVFLYEGRVDEPVDPIMLESEVTEELGEPAAQVEHAHHERCREAVRERLADESGGGDDSSEGGEIDENGGAVVTTEVAES